MIQPSVYSYSQIIDTAFELIKEQGWRAVSARAIAKKLGSSTMPIYSRVKSVDDLEKDLRIKARKLLKDYQLRGYTKEILMNLAFGYVSFARDEKNLFRFLYLEKPEKVDLERMSGMKESIINEFGKDSEVVKALDVFHETAQEDMIKYTWIFTHGLAMMINSGALENDTDEDILDHLKAAGESFYMLKVMKNNLENGMKG